MVCPPRMYMRRTPNEVAMAATTVADIINARRMGRPEPEPPMQRDRAARVVVERLTLAEATDLFGNPGRVRAFIAEDRARINEMTLDTLVREARWIRQLGVFFHTSWQSPDPDGPGYRSGAPLQLFGEWDDLANEAAGLVHAKVDAILRNRPVRASGVTRP